MKATQPTCLQFHELGPLRLKFVTVLRAEKHARLGVHRCHIKESMTRRGREAATQAICSRFSWCLKPEVSNLKTFRGPAVIFVAVYRAPVKILSLGTVWLILQPSRGPQNYDRPKSLTPLPYIILSEV